MLKKLLFILVLISPLSVMGGPSESTKALDPFYTTNYLDAFDTEVFRDYLDVLKVEGVSTFEYLASSPPRGCWRRFCRSSRPSRCRKSCSRTSEDDEAFELGSRLDYSTYERKREQMEVALLAQLRRAKASALWRPTGTSAIGIISMLPVSIAGFETVRSLPAPQQALGLWPLMDMFYRLGEGIKNTMSSAYNYISPAGDPLEGVEKEFAVKLPYATEQERSLIIKTFGTERTKGTYETQELGLRIGLIKSMKKNQLEFDKSQSEDMPDMGLPLPNDEESSYALLEDEKYEERKEVDLDDSEDPILNFLEDYFKQYRDGDEARNSIIGAVRGYVAKIRGGRNTGAYTILLQGPFGIGKSHFAKELQKLMTSLFYGQSGESFPFQLVAYTSGENLVGTATEPGALLTALSKFSTNYGIIFLDEGDLDSLGETAKLLFDTSGTSYPFPYLRGGSKSLENYLMIVCTNKPLEDLAIGSRVVKVDFPTPGQELVAGVVEKVVKEVLQFKRPDNMTDREKKRFNYYYKHPKIQEIIKTQTQLRLRDLVQKRIEEINFERRRRRSS